MILGATTGNSRILILRAQEELVADFAFYPEHPFAGMVITFNASSSYPPSLIASYEWDFGDGNSKAGKVINHSYCKPGNYTVNLTVKDDLGNYNSVTKKVTVKGLEDEFEQIKNKIDSFNELKDEFEQIRNEVDTLKESNQLMTNIIYILVICVVILCLGVIFSFWHLRKDVSNNRKWHLVFEKRFVELEKKISEFPPPPPPPEDEKSMRTAYNEFVGNIAVFEELASLTGKTMDELYSLYSDYRLKEYKGSCPPVEEFLFYIGNLYNLDFVKVWRGQKPVGLVIADARQKDASVDSAGMTVHKKGFYLFRTVLDEKIVSLDIVRRAKDLKIKCLIDLTYIKKAGIPEIQLGSRNPLTLQLIDQIISSLKNQGIYAKKADERFLGGPIVHEAEKQGLRGIQLTFIGMFSEDDLKELLTKILDTILPVF
ncbi:MAG: PKD domain-containing protein [Thermoproteota archaeon]